MLDATTKWKIDSARQILVGKVPDPKAQVEQITTALVYKFMDDMDKESQELGGQTRFFATVSKNTAGLNFWTNGFPERRGMIFMCKPLRICPKIRTSPRFSRIFLRARRCPITTPRR